MRTVFRGLQPSEAKRGLRPSEARLRRAAAKRGLPAERRSEAPPRLRRAKRGRAKVIGRSPLQKKSKTTKRFHQKTQGNHLFFMSEKKNDGNGLLKRAGSWVDLIIDYGLRYDVGRHASTCGNSAWSKILIANVHSPLLDCFKDEMHVPGWCTTYE